MSKTNELPDGLAEFLQDTQMFKGNNNTDIRDIKVPSIDELRSKFKTKSAVVRYLYSLGLTINEIHHFTTIRYQMVRNILTTELKRGPNEDWQNKFKPEADDEKDAEEHN